MPACLQIYAKYVGIEQFPLKFKSGRNCAIGSFDNPPKNIIASKPFKSSTRISAKSFFILVIFSDK